MAGTTDFIHDEEVVDAVIDELEENLPSAWTSGTDGVYRLKRIEFGDLSTWRPPSGRQMSADECPLILVYADRSDNATEVYGGIGGVEGATVPVRVTHVFHRSQCMDKTTATKWIQPARAQAQRAKVIHKALFADTGRKMSSPTLTTSDTTAKIIEARPGAITYSSDDEGDFLTVSIDILVATRTD